MPAVITRGQTFAADEQVTNTKLHNLVDNATIAGIDQTNMANNIGLVLTTSSAPTNTDALWIDSNDNYNPKTFNNGISAWEGGNWEDLENLTVVKASVNTVDIDADKINIDGFRFVDVDVTANIAVSGANGLDDDVEATSTWYAVWLIGKTTGGDIAALLSESATAPVMPSGYTLKRRVGWIYNDDGDDFQQTDCIANIREDLGLDPVAWEFELTGLIEDDAWHDLDLSALLPPSAVSVIMSIEFAASSAGVDIKFRKNGLSNVFDSQQLRNQVANIIIKTQMVVNCDTSRVIEYILDSPNTTIVNIAITGWYKKIA